MSRIDSSRRALPWPMRAPGFVIYDQLAVSGRIVCRERKDKPAQQTQA